MREDPGNGWSKYEQQVLYRLDDLAKKVDALDSRVDERIGKVQNRINEIAADDISELKTEIAMLKVKSGVWGATAGLIPFGLFIAARMAGAGD